MPDACLQRLSVFIQLKRQHDESLEQEVTITPTIINSSYTLENTAIVFDSMHSEVSTHELMAGKKSWHQLLQDFDLADPPPGSSIAFTAIQLIFEAIADKWSDYILSMHNYIAALEEEIYEQPANDLRADALWRISKQLLQAERLIKFHVLLLQNVGNDLNSLPENTMGPDWLVLNLTEYKRLSSEVEETLKKPVAHMVDLVCFLLCALLSGLIMAGRCTNQLAFMMLVNPSS